jgi:hypothetical protein
VLALIEAAEALNDLMSGIDYSGEPSGSESIARARQALDRFDFTQAADRE